MAVKIRLKRMGKIRTSIYRVVVMDSRTKRDGRAIEEIGKYDPTQEPSLIDIDMDRAGYWLGQGAQPTEAVAALLKKYEDGTLRVAEPKPSKKSLYEAAVAAAGSTSDDGTGATTPRKRAAKKVEEPQAAEAPAAEAPAAQARAEEAPSAEAAAEEAPAAAAEEPVAADTDGGAAAADSTDADADKG